MNLKVSDLREEIYNLRKVEAKKIVEGLETGRFSYDIERRSETIDRGTIGDYTRYYNESEMFLSVMGLKIPVGRNN